MIFKKNTKIIVYYKSNLCSYLINECRAYYFIGDSRTPNSIYISVHVSKIPIDSSCNIAM